MKKIDGLLHEKLTQLIRSMGYDFVGCEMLPQGGSLLLRIYIDQLENAGKKGVTIDDCSLVSHQVGAMLDVDDLIHGRYTLEVSSPGIDRPLFELDHFRRFIGQRIKIRLLVPVNQKRQYKGILSRVDGDAICLVVDEVATSEVVLPFAAIDKANLVGEM